MNVTEWVRSERLSPALSFSVMLHPVNLPDTLVRRRCNGAPRATKELLMNRFHAQTAVITQFSKQRLFKSAYTNLHALLITHVDMQHTLQYYSVHPAFYSSKWEIICFTYSASLTPFVGILHLQLIRISPFTSQLKHIALFSGTSS